MENHAGKPIINHPNRVFVKLGTPAMEQTHDYDYTHDYGSSHQCVLHQFIVVILPMMRGVIIRPKLRPLVPHSPAWKPGTSAPRPRAGPVGRGDGTSIQRPASAVECRRCTTRRTYGFFYAKSIGNLAEVYGKPGESYGKSMEIYGNLGNRKER